MEILHDVVRTTLTGATHSLSDWSQESFPIGASDQQQLLSITVCYPHNGAGLVPSHRGQQGTVSRAETLLSYFKSHPFSKVCCVELNLVQTIQPGHISLPSVLYMSSVVSPPVNLPVL